MKRTTLAIGALIVALVASNAFWTYKLLDQGVSYSYLNDSYQLTRNVARQALAIIPAAADPGASRDSIIAAAKSADANRTEPFEKDDHLWVGAIGLRFDESGRLVGVRASSDPL